MITIKICHLEILLVNLVIKKNFLFMRKRMTILDVSKVGRSFQKPPTDSYNINER